MRGVRLDPLLARGLVLEGVVVRLGPWRLSAPALVVGVHWSALWRGELEAVLSASRFRLAVDAADGPEALVVLYREIERLRPPPVSLSLRGGTVETRNGRTLLAGVTLDLGRFPRGVRVRLDARQVDGGRLDVHGAADSAAAEAVRVDLYLDEFASQDLRRWIALGAGIAEGRLAGRALPVVATGRWHLRLDRGRAARHRFDLEVRTRGSGSGHAAGRLAARSTGSLAIHPPAAPAGAHPETTQTAGARVSGALRVAGRIERLHTLLASRTPERRLLVSGPIGATVSFGGSTLRPRVTASVDLGETHLGLGAWFQKAPGTPTRLRLRGTSSRSGRTLEVDGRVGELRAEGRLGAEGDLVVRTRWLSVAELSALSPELGGRLHAGRVRAIARRKGAEPLRARIDLAHVELGTSASSAQRLTLSGSSRLEGAQLAAHALRAELGGVPFSLDLGAGLARRAAGPHLLLRFAARAGHLDLGGPPARPAPTVSEASADGFPGPLRAVAQESVSLLRRQRALLERVELAEGRIDAARVDASGETLRDLRVELGLADLRLEVRRFAFQRGGALHEVRGFVDLDELLPEFVLAGEGRP